MILKWNVVIKWTESLWLHCIKQVCRKIRDFINIRQYKCLCTRLLKGTKKLVCDRKRPGSSRSIRTKRAIKAVRDRIRSNPIQKKIILSRKKKIATSKNHVAHFKRWLRTIATYKRRTDYFLTDNNKKNRVEKSKQLLK